MKIIGKVLQEERDEIKNLYMRKLSLIDLVKSLKDDDAIYEKVISDLSKTNEKFENWWNEIGAKYCLEGRGSTSNWTINFDTCEISLCD
ncbi:MAG: CXXX repeat peptide modification system protein [Treponema sp.]|nr:CXXX repeat peptide modification system protein [Candidatus Treponema equifaecale]